MQLRTSAMPLNIGVFRGGSCIQTDCEKSPWNLHETGQTAPHDRTTTRWSPSAHASAWTATPTTPAHPPLHQSTCPVFWGVGWGMRSPLCGERDGPGSAAVPPLLSNPSRAGGPRATEIRGWLSPSKHTHASGSMKIVCLRTCLVLEKKVPSLPVQPDCQTTKNRLERTDHAT